MMVGRVGFEPTVDSRRWIMSPVPATNTASGPSLLSITDLVLCVNCKVPGTFLDRHTVWPTWPLDYQRT